MRYLRPVFLFVLAFAILGLSADEASAQKKRALPPRKAKHHVFRGVVVHVHHNKEKKHTGKITVKHHNHGQNKLGNQNDSTEERTFHVNHSTTFERVDVSGKGKGGKRTVHTAHFHNVHKGQHVAIHHKGHEATDVKILHHHKK